MSNIFIPEKIAVGFQNRSDTYTQKLAYVVYYDAKGKRRKEASWESWCDKSIEKIDYENVPTSGFVLNKKVGGYKSDWNFRQAYVRVYDPRGFEFEITIPNLLFVLENNSSIKGKGLEGEFVYAWDGADLLLLPVDSPDYQKIKGYSEMVKAPERIISKELVLGGTYLTKKQEQWVYLGRFEKYSTEWKKGGTPLGPHYFFANGSGFEAVKSISGKFISIVSTEPVANYAELMDELEHCRIYSPSVEGKFEYVRVTIPPFGIDQHRYPPYDPNKVGMMGLYFKYKNAMWQAGAITHPYEPTGGKWIAKADAYCIDANRWGWAGQNGDLAYDGAKKEYPNFFDSRVGVDIDTLNTLEFYEKYQYLANGKLYHR